MRRLCFHRCLSVHRGLEHAWLGCVWGESCRARGAMHGRGSMARGVRGRGDGHCSGRYASYWNAFLLRNHPQSTVRRQARSIYFSAPIDQGEEVVKRNIHERGKRQGRCTTTTTQPPTTTTTTSTPKTVCVPCDGQQVSKSTRKPSGLLQSCSMLLMTLMMSCDKSTISWPVLHTIKNSGEIVL